MGEIVYNFLEGTQLLPEDIVSITWLDGSITKEIIKIELNELGYKKAFINKNYNGVLAKIFLEDNPQLLYKRFYK